MKMGITATWVIAVGLVGTPGAVRAMEWEQQSKLTASDGSGQDDFGYSVSNYGDTAIVGARFHEDSGGIDFNAGAAYVFSRTVSGWSEQAHLTPLDPAAGDYFGSSVSLGSDRVAVGAYGKAGCGATYVFEKTGGVWGQTAQIVASDGQSSDYFGFGGSLSGTRLLVGAFGAGAAYVYDLDGGSWVETAKLVASDRTNGDHFAWSVSLSGDRALIGSRHHDDNGTSSGCAYIFEKVNGAWTETGKLLASDAHALERFGYWVSLEGDTALVGAPGNPDESEAGAVYLFRKMGSNWVEEAKLYASDASAGDDFGVAVSLSGDFALIGADRNGKTAGSTYLFEDNGSGWLQVAKLTGSSMDNSDWFGYAVSMNGTAALVGAYLETNDLGTDAGAAYLFTPVPEPATMTLLVLGGGVLTLIRRRRRK